MPFTKSAFPDLLVFEPVVFGDERGYFFEAFNHRTFLIDNVNMNFVQDNQAKSSYGVVRGLHFQIEPHAQTKLIRVLQGEILDVVVDMRIDSPTYGKVFSIRLSAENKKQLLVPKGFAHGYSVLSETSEVFYKCDDYYSRECEGGIAFNDPALAIDWMVPAEKMILSPKDLQHPSFEESTHKFFYQAS